MREAPVGFHCPDDAALSRSERPRLRTSVGGRWRDSPPYLTAALIAANVALYLYTGMTSTGGLGDPHTSPLFREWQLVPYFVYHGDEYYRFVTAAFLHVSPLHIGMNMLALGIIGAPLERLLGRWRLGALYALGLLGGSAAIFAFGSPELPVVGASGAIFGMFAASLVLVRHLGLDPQWLVGIIVLNFVFTFSIPDVSALGHVGGFVGGGLAGLAIAGWPSRSLVRRATNVQVLGMVGVAVLIAVLVAVRATAGSGSF
jgi:membrane associated rhomboid family serine protease